MYSNMILF